MSGSRKRREHEILQVAEAAFDAATIAVNQFLQLLELLDRGEVTSAQDRAELRASMRQQLKALEEGRAAVRMAQW